MTHRMRIKPRIKRSAVMTLIIWALILYCWSPAKADEMPPLFVPLFLPAIFNQPAPPVFPPCECDPNEDQCVC